MPGFEEDDYLWLNQGNGNRWVEVELEGVRSNRSGVGARLVATTGSGREVFIDRQVGIGFGNTHSPRLRFGLGLEDQVERIDIAWPSGIRQTLIAPAIETLHPVLETGLVVTGVPTAGASLELAAAGPSGHLAELYLGLGPLDPPLPLPQLGGYLNLLPPLLPIGATLLGADGEGALSLPLPATTAGQTFHLQGWVRPAGQLLGGTPTPGLAVTVL